MIDTLVGAELGGIPNWWITHHYYTRSLTALPEWARPPPARLAESVPSSAQLKALISDVLQETELVVSEAMPREADECPACSQRKFELWDETDEDDEELHVVRCTVGDRVEASFSEHRAEM